MRDFEPATRESLLAVLGEGELYNLDAFLDAQEMGIVKVARDLIDYCRGDVEGTDLQLSDSKDLPLAQVIAEEELALERGSDEEGLPFGPEDVRYHRLPRVPGAGFSDAATILDEWLTTLNIALPPDDSPA